MRSNSLGLCVSEKERKKALAWEPTCQTDCHGRRTLSTHSGLSDPWAWWRASRSQSRWAERRSPPGWSTGFSIASLYLWEQGEVLTRTSCLPPLYTVPASGGWARPWQPGSTWDFCSLDRFHHPLYFCACYLGVQAWFFPFCNCNSLL